MRPVCVRQCHRQCVRVNLRLCVVVAACLYVAFVLLSRAVIRHTLLHTPIHTHTHAHAHTSTNTHSRTRALHRRTRTNGSILIPGRGFSVCSGGLFFFFFHMTRCYNNLIGFIVCICCTLCALQAADLIWLDVIFCHIAIFFSLFLKGFSSVGLRCWRSLS